MVAAIAPKLEFAEFARVKQKPVSSLDAYDLYLRALQLDYECTEESLDNQVVSQFELRVSLSRSNLASTTPSAPART